MGNRPSPLQQAIIDQDEKAAALHWRNQWASELIEASFRGRDTYGDVDVSKLDGVELLLAVVAPGPELREISEKKAKELVAAGPFVQRRPPDPVCARDGCTNTFKAGSGRSQHKKYCCDHCRKTQYFNGKGRDKRMTPEFRQKNREYKARRRLRGVRD